MKRTTQTMPKAVWIAGNWFRASAYVSTYLHHGKPRKALFANVASGGYALTDGKAGQKARRLAARVRALCREVRTSAARRNKKGRPGVIFKKAIRHAEDMFGMYADGGNDAIMLRANWKEKLEELELRADFWANRQVNAGDHVLLRYGNGTQRAEVMKVEPKRLQIRRWQTSNDRWGAVSHISRMDERLLEHHVKLNGVFHVKAPKAETPSPGGKFGRRPQAGAAEDAHSDRVTDVSDWPKRVDKA